MKRNLCQWGYSQKKPNSSFTVHQHIERGSSLPSQYISCSASLEAIVNFARRSKTRPARIATISVNELEGQWEDAIIYDLSDPGVRYQHLHSKHANNRAAKIQEVLIEGYVPPSCIPYVIDIECKYEYLYRLLRKQEDPLEDGLDPKSPDADFDVRKFVKDGGSIASQFISTCASFKAVKRFAANATNACKRIAKIDIRTLMESGVAGFIDLTERENRELYLDEDLLSDAWRSARSNKEVLVVGNIPNDCIKAVFNVYV